MTTDITKKVTPHLIQTAETSMLKAVKTHKIAKQQYFESFKHQRLCLLKSD